MLSAKLREAADYVVAHPVDVATRSLRTVSKDAELSPATFSRMSAALGYTSYEELRDVLRASIKPASPFTAGVDALQKSHGSGEEGSFLKRHAEACARNLYSLHESIDAKSLDACIKKLSKARKVAVIGALGSTGIASYLVYMASFIADNWFTPSQSGTSFGGGLAGLTDKDVLIVLTKPPFAAVSIETARVAHQQGAFVIVLTDTHTCPALVHASAHFIVPTSSPHFYSSYASTLALCEIMIGMLAARAGSDARARISEVELANRSLNEIWSG